MTRVSKPSLALLLADLPEDRLDALATSWGLPTHLGAGRRAQLYHVMTEARARATILNRLPEQARLVYERLATAGAPLSAVDLQRVLPLSDETMNAALAVLAEAGLAWHGATGGRGATLLEQQWFVPDDLRDRELPPLGPCRHQPSRAVAAPTAAVPAPRPVETPRGQVWSARVFAVLLGEPVADQVKTTRGNRATDQDFEALASYYGAALGVWAADSTGSIHRRPGPHAVAWQNLDLPARVRALARLWLVDERSPHPVPATVRHALWDALASFQAGTWYDVDTLARRVAWLASASQGHRGTASPSTPNRRLVSISRSDLDRAIELLGWIGVIQVAQDRRGHPTAVRLTPEGEGALR